MVIDKKGKGLVIDGKMFFVGSYYIANSTTEHKGLIGKILEIRTAENKDTNNIGPDIYIDFDDDEVIMSADMLEKLPF